MEHVCRCVSRGMQGARGCWIMNVLSGLDCASSRGRCAYLDAYAPRAARVSTRTAPLSSTWAGAPQMIGARDAISGG